MKTLYRFLSIILSLTLLSSSCKKEHVNQLSLLPPVTQTGANTFGCLVNGQALVPGGPLFSMGHTQCNYIYTAGGFNLNVEADNQNSNDFIKQVIVRTESLAVAQGQTLVFKIAHNGNADALYAEITNSLDNIYLTNSLVSGQLTITKLDQTNQIVSGTFYFNAVNSTGDTVKVTDGRFDMPYTR